MRDSFSFIDESGPILYLQAGYPGTPGRQDLVPSEVAGAMVQGASMAACEAGFELLVKRAPCAGLRQVFDDLRGRQSIRGILYATFGGDSLLRHLAERARLVLRGEDVLARLGGDEFVALLPNTDVIGARVVAERLREALLDAHMLFHGQEVPAPLSIGVAQLRADDLQLDSLLKRADQAMYRAKRAGGDRVELAPAG